MKDMKTLLPSFAIALCVAIVLYAKINLGLTWRDLTDAISNLIPAALAVGVLLGTVLTLAFFNRSDRPD